MIFIHVETGELILVVNSYCIGDVSYYVVEDTPAFKEYWETNNLTLDDGFEFIGLL